MPSYLQLSQNPDLPEHKRFEYLAAHKMDMLVWEDAKVEFCQQHGVPENRDYGITLVSKDSKKTVFVASSDVNWKHISAFLAYSNMIFNTTPVLITKSTTKISKMVIRAIPDIVFIGKSGEPKDRTYYAEKIAKSVESKSIIELKNMSKPSDAPPKKCKPPK